MTVNGLFMGILLGIGLSIGITVFITNGKSPFVSKDTNGACIEIQGAKPEGEATTDAIQDQPTKFDCLKVLMIKASQNPLMIFAVSAIVSPRPSCNSSPRMKIGVPPK